MADRYFKLLCGLGVVYARRMEGPGYCRELYLWWRTARAFEDGIRVMGLGSTLSSAKPWSKGGVLCW